MTRELQTLFTHCLVINVCDDWKRSVCETVLPLEKISIHRILDIGQ